MVFALEGDSTTTRVPDICRYSIPSTREAEGGRRNEGASGRGRYHQAQRWRGSRFAGRSDPSEPGERRHRVAIFRGSAGTTPAATLERPPLTARSTPCSPSSTTP